MDREVREIPPANDSSSHFKKQNREYPCARRGCKDASPIVSFLFGELRSISRDDARGEKFFSTRAPPFFNRGGRSLSRLHFALCPPDIVRHVLFFRRRFLWKQGAYVGKETPRGWRMFCNFSGLLVSRAVLVFLLKQSSHPLANWKDTFLSFSNCTDLSGFSFFFPFFRCDKYRRSQAIDLDPRWCKCGAREFSKGKGFFRYFYVENLYPRGFNYA